MATPAVTQQASIFKAGLQNFRPLGQKSDRFASIGCAAIGNPLLPTSPLGATPDQRRR